MKKATSNRLRVLRAEHRLTQRDVAKRTGINMMRFWNIENDYIEPTLEECKALAKVLKVKVADLGLPACVAEPTGVRS